MAAHNKKFHLTAAEQVLSAAARAFRRDQEFTEWDLSYEAWRAFPERFAMRGYPFPDHKRVMQEMVATSKRSIDGEDYAVSFKPIPRGFMVKTCPNHFKVTDLGRAYGFACHESQKDPLSGLYSDIDYYTTRPEFLMWRHDSAKPYTLNESLHFFEILGIKETKGKGRSYINSVRSEVNQAIEYCEKNGLVYFVRYKTEPIPIELLYGLQDFLVALEYKFPEFFLDGKPVKA